MAAPYDLTDDKVVVIIGSGAGGGTLGNELAQKGIDVVTLKSKVPGGISVRVKRPVAESAAATCSVPSTCTKAGARELSENRTRPVAETMDRSVRVSRSAWLVSVGIPHRAIAPYPSE